MLWFFTFVISIRAAVGIVTGGRGYVSGKENCNGAKCLYIHTYIYIYIYIDTHIHNYVHIYIYIHTYIPHLTAMNNIITDKRIQFSVRLGSKERGYFYVIYCRYQIRCLRWLLLQHNTLLFTASVLDSLCRITITASVLDSLCRITITASVLDSLCRITITEFVSKFHIISAAPAKSLLKSSASHTVNYSQVSLRRVTC
jgi:hypothetical protein